MEAKAVGRADQPVPRIALAGLLIIAGAMHAALAAEHLEESTIMGIGFVCAAVVQFLLAAGILVRPHAAVYAATILVSAALLGLYAYNVVIGLPWAGPVTAQTDEHSPTASDEGREEHQGGEEHAGGDAHAVAGEHREGLQVGGGEPIDPAGAATKLAEFGAAALALMLWRRQSTGAV